jgi:CRP/FNR family transcriptional regulator, cyclic AMP receptor protein
MAGIEADRDHATAVARERGWLSRQPRDFQDAVLGRAVLRTREAGEVLYHVGDPGGGLFGLVDGLVKLEVAVAGGTYRVATIGQPGFWIGAYAALRSSSRIVTVRVARRSTFLNLPHADLELLMRNAIWCRALADLVAEELEEAILVIGYALSGTPELRVAGRLASLARLYGSGNAAVLEVTQSDLSEMCGLARQTVQQALGHLEAQGLVEVGYRRITVCDAARLMALTDAGRR